MSIVLLQCIFITASFAQKEVSGKVVDSATGEPLSNVSVITDKKKSGTSTGVDGSFKLPVDSKTSIIIFSSVGYTSQTFPIGSAPSVVRLAKSAAALDEVVVIGYGSVKRSNVTGSISKYSNQRMDEQPVSRVDQALQGKIAGVQVQNVSSESGSDPKIRVRGLSSINAGASPLVVVDGHPVQDGLNFVNPADVASVEVLKDAASAAIYGSRGASGVILITTKSGKADRPKYNIKYSAGSKNAYKRYDMLTTTEYTNLLFYEASLRAKDPSVPANQQNLINNNERAAYVIENSIVGGPTNWQDQALRNATVQNVQLNVSGGSRVLKYYISGGYQDDPGLMYHSEYKKYNLRTKLEAQLSNRVKITLNTNPSYINRERPSVNYIDFVRFYSYLPVYHTEATAAYVNSTGGNVRVGDFVQANDFNSRTYSGFMPDGSFWTSGTSATTPFSTSNNTPKSTMENRTIKSNEYRMLSSGDITVNIIRGLDFKMLGSAYVAYNSVLDFAKRNAARQGDLNKGQYNDRRFVDLLWENTLNYNKKFGNDHELTAVAGFTSQKTRIRDQQAVGQDYPSDNITTLNTAAIKDVANTYDSLTQIGLNSVLGRIQYAYQNKYLLSVSLRADESSFFAPGHKWGYFPAASIGWVATQEKFLKDVSWLNNLKLRASYGVSGNNRINEVGSAGAYPYIDLLYASNYSFGNGSGTSQGFAPSSFILANPDLTWERTFQYNTGIDVSLFRNIISLSVDVYQSQTDKLLLQQNTQLFLGVSKAWNNIGKLQNRGIEFEITANPIRGKYLRWNVSGNISHNRNELLEFGQESRVLNLGERNEVYLNQVGSPTIQYYAYKTNGVWLSQQEIDDAKAKGLNSQLTNVFVPGGLKLVDVDGNNVIDANDRVASGSPYPDFTYGLTNSFNYKSFDLSFTFQGSQGGKLINGDPNYNESRRINRVYLKNRWLSPANPGDGKTPYNVNGFNWMLTDYVIEDASYIALREVILGYTLPANIVSRLKLNSARFYFSAQNLWYGFAKGYRGINPEGRFNSGPYISPLIDGYQRGSFPLPQTLLFGLDINF